MATTEKFRNKLLDKLTELFQLNQPDLDFGFYRIMKAKSEQVKTFIDKDLLQIIEDAFGQVDDSKKVELQSNIDKEIETAKGYGVTEPENSPKVLEAIARFDELKDGSNSESAVYDHLYRFFERYYDEGDFVSRRYYTRENSGKAAPYAIPYNGEEVKLHWANADQYYVKTAEYFSNFTFDLVKAKELQKEPVAGEFQFEDATALPESLKVHFRIVDANEGEHGNVKATDDKKRFFVLYESNPIEFNEAGELIVNFEYKSLPSGKNDVDDDMAKSLKEKYGKSLNKGDMPNLAIADKIIESVKSSEKADLYISALEQPAPTEKISNRPLIAKYINQYTARNTCDYFIHKDLGGFLKRELDFYIKNEVMHLDDIESADAPAVESYLKKLKVIRKIATKLIEFLAQLEDFQKKLWLKKKFVTETNYCITLDRIPEELYKEVVANDAQREEWVKLFAIDEIEATEVLPGMGAPGYSVPLSIEFLKANDKLVLDTAFFDDEFKAKLIESIEDFDEQCDGLLIHSENFQALNLLQERYREQIKCVYIDPPYNTGSDGFAYKDSYQSSSWLSFIGNRIIKSTLLLTKDGSNFTSIGDEENDNLRKLFEEVWGEGAYKSTIIIRRGIKNVQAQFETIDALNRGYEFVLHTVPNDNIRFEKLLISNGLEEEEENPGGWNNHWRGTDRPTMRYEIFGIKPEKGQWRWGEDRSKEAIKNYQNCCKTLNTSNPTQQQIDEWHQKEYQITNAKVNLLRLSRNGKPEHYIPPSDGKLASDIWIDLKPNGSRQLNNVLPDSSFETPKSFSLVERLILFSNGSDNKTITLDYFAGSGTTGHAVINLNREDNGKRKYILVEMGDYFDTVTKPRISKVVYSPDWKDGKPTSRDKGISQCFKYIRLESYEDTLNNIVFDDNQIRDRVMAGNDSLKEDYMLHYLLDVETRGSKSLLNIDFFKDPTRYTLNVKKSGSDAQEAKHLDLIETFNYLIGLRVTHYASPTSFTANFRRNPDPELPEDQHTKLVVVGKIKSMNKRDSGKAEGADHCKSWWFRKLEGWVPADRMNPNNGLKERVLVVWRKLTGNLEEDNLMLDEWFQEYRISPRDFEFDTIYVNGSNNLPNLKKVDENWKVCLIEEEFHKRMWESE